jgi:hypothetical protein
LVASVSTPREPAIAGSRLSCTLHVSPACPGDLVPEVLIREPGTREPGRGKTLSQRLTSTGALDEGGGAGGVGGPGGANSKLEPDDVCTFMP